MVTCPERSGRTARTPECRQWRVGREQFAVAAAAAPAGDEVEVGWTAGSATVVSLDVDAGDAVDGGAGLGGLNLPRRGSRRARTA